jgi:hypothetical protein
MLDTIIEQIQITQTPEPGLLGSGLLRGRKAA